MSNGTGPILVVHERYVHAGGEDTAVDADLAMLRSRGHRVESWSCDNSEIARWSAPRRASLLWRTTWSSSSYRALGRLVRELKPRLAHFHNTLPLFSPSVVRCAYDFGVPTVMTLHNYRLMCPTGTLLRSGRICEDCHTHSLLRGVIHGCYRGSHAQTATVAMMLAVHRLAGTWARCVDAYIAPSEFMRSKIISSGIPQGKVHVRANPVADSPLSPVSPEPFVLFAGRLSEEKGVSTILQTARLIPAVKFKIAGTGPLRERLDAWSRAAPGQVELLGQLSQCQLGQLMPRARVLLFPSICYEALPTTILEAMSRGVPVIATDLGGRRELITDGREGYLYAAGDPAELAQRISSIMNDDALRDRMGRNALATFRERYSLDRSYRDLMHIYDLAIASSSARRAIT